MHHQLIFRRCQVLELREVLQSTKNNSARGYQTCHRHTPQCHVLWSLEVRCLQVLEIMTFLQAIKVMIMCSWYQSWSQALTEHVQVLQVLCPQVLKIFKILVSYCQVLIV